VFHAIKPPWRFQIIQAIITDSHIIGLNGNRQIAKTEKPKKNKSHIIAIT